MSAAQDDDVQEFAALLRRLKDRTDRSYGQLARRLNMNTSTLHRYCAGDAVPLDFAPVERFAALCEATPEERLELHRRWILAVAARQRSRTAGPAATDRADGAPSSAAACPPADSSTEAAEGPTPGAPAHRPWYRRRRLLVSAAVATALLATLGSLSALPDDDRSRASDSVQGADPTRTPTAGTPGPTSTASPKHSPTTPTPSDGAPTSKKPSAKPTGPSDRPSEKSGAQQPPAGAPLTWSANSHVWQAGCGHDYVITKPSQQVPPPPPPQDAEIWARSQGAVHGGQTMVEITVQGRTSTAVVLEALRVRVAGRAAPVQGTSYAMDHGCGGALTPRYFDVDLDKDRPIARPADGNDSGTTIPAMKLPYRVSAEDPEVLLVDARTDGCDCNWYLELDWSSQGRTGTARIDDHGRPFRTTSTKGLPNYAYDTSAREWAPYE
ncbi:DNA-binding protein [Streptomyces viridochromogenes]|uniref:DNA-binding protein n=1 Tax=Streptomyces viridochromogenes TaxID=1938 RepID=A0A0J7YTA3_STRVR|nr:helix-turn-helix transcriptional regulator [Streptomyces viridochromogenes]KMS66682.1 DNA-binding protein [Streptomyces viridochromogenes]KOG25147.1 DNA-binding protein [Streptomyces viridochromogenes]KOG25880.1 DNA-binding protein [Streptomyces viridochromogenes]